MAFELKGVLAACLAAAAVLAADGGLAQDRSPGPDAPPPVPRAALPLPPGQPIPPGELEAFVDGVAAEAMSADHIAGAAVTVVQNGKVVLKKGYGADRLSPARAVDPDRTLFRLGSMTKTFTWIALMREIEANHIRLDGRINVYLPQEDQIPDEGYSRPILIRDLMTHTPGFEDRRYGQLIEKDPRRIRALDVYLHQERPHRVREAGSLPSHSNYGAALAGEALVQVTGKTVHALLEGEITGPLGMSRTTLREPYPRRNDLPAPMDAAIAADVSQGFGWTGSGFRERPFEYMTQVAPAAAASSTAGDMSRYMLAILGDGTLNGATIYSPAIAKDFRTTLQRSAPGVPGWDYGFAEYALPGGFHGFGHSGSTLSFHASMVTVPELGLGVFVAANTETGEPFTATLPERIVQRFYAPAGPVAPEPSAWLRQNASAFAGSYLTTRRAYHGLESFAHLMASEVAVRVADNGTLLVPGRAGPTAWTPDPSASLEARYVAFHQIGGPGQMVFEMERGQARRWFTPSGGAAYERAGVLTFPSVLAALALATGVAAIAAIAGVFLRDRREFRQTSIQGRADAAQISGSILWLGALTCFLVWRMGISDAANLMYGWPGPWVFIASSCGFVAAVLTVLCLLLLPVVWRGGRRLDSWTGGRKARFTLTTLVFSAFALLVGLWGGLEPWSR